MKEKKILGKASILLIAAFLILSTSAVMANTTVEPVANTITFEGETVPLSMDEEALYFYDPGTFPTTRVGLQGGGPYSWKTAIRLTSDELMQYAGWNVTAIRVYHGEANFEHWGDVIVYDEGSASNPGPELTSEPYHFNTVEWYRLDLTSPVPIDGSTDLWIACSWETDEDDFPAVLDAGPAIRTKGDFIFMNNVWQELWPSGAPFDANWGIEAIVEGEGTIWTELELAVPTGPIGVSTSVKNIGENPATNVTYELTVVGGILGLINKTITGDVVELAIGAEEGFTTGLILGLGSIDITIAADADNADPVSASYSALVLGPFVLRIE